MAKVKITVVESKCRGGYHRKGDEYIVEDVCPPICHELWSQAYPAVYALLNDGLLDYGPGKAPMADFRCPDEGRVLIHCERMED